MGDTVASDDSNIGKEEARGHSGVVGATSTRTSGSTAEPSPRLLLLNGNDTDRATLEFRPSFHLREEWPEGVVGADGTANGRGLVVCSVDVQLLTDTINVMHTQIDLLRQAVLDLRKDATNRSVRDQKNTENIKRKLGELEKLSHLSTAQPQSTAEMQLDTMETRMQALEQRPYLQQHGPEDLARAEEMTNWRTRIECIESTVWGRSVARDKQSRVGEDDAVMEGDIESEDESEQRSRFTRKESEAANNKLADAEELGGLGVDDSVYDAKPTEETLESSVEHHTRGVTGDQEMDVSSLKPGKMRSTGMAVMLSTRKPVIPEMNKMQKQLNKLIKFNKEAQLNVRVAVLERDRSVAAAGFESAAAERGRALLGKILRQETFLRSSLVAEGLDVDAGQEGILGEGGEGCWIDGMPQSWGEEKCVEKHDDEALLERARERLAWIEARAGETPDSSRHSTTDTAPIESHTVRNGTSFDDESTKRRKLEAAPGGGSDSWPVQKAEKGEASFQDEVEWLSQQMEDVQRRVYRKIEVHQLRSSQNEKEINLQDLQESLNRSSSTLSGQIEEGLSGLSQRIDILESGLSQEEHAAAEAAAAARTAKSPVRDGRAEEMTLVRRQLESVAERIAVLEAAFAGTSTASDEGRGESDNSALTQAVIAAAAGQAARDAVDLAIDGAVGGATDRVESRLMAEISALEERVDRRAHDATRRAREEKEVTEVRTSMRRVSETVEAYTADIAARLELLVADNEKTGMEIVRATGEIAAAEDGLKKMGEELIDLGQVANNVATVVDEKANQTDVEALKQAMLRLDVSVAKNRGVQAAREAEAIGALQASFKDMSSSMQRSIQKLQKAQQSTGSIKIKPLLDRVVSELSAAGLLPDPDIGQGAVGRSQCLSCNRPMAIANDHSTFTSHVQGLGARMASAAHSSPQLHVNKPSAVWRGGFRMPPTKTPTQQRQQTPFAGGGARGGAGHIGRAGVSAGLSNSVGGREYGGSHSSPSASIPTDAWSQSARGGPHGQETILSGIPNILNDGGAVGGGGTGGGGGIGVGGGAGGVGGEVGAGGSRGAGNPRRATPDAPHRGRFVRDGRLNRKRV